MVPPDGSTKQSNGGEHGGLAGARRPGQRQPGPRRDLERDAPEGGAAAAGVVDRQVRHDEGGDRDRSRNRGGPARARRSGDASRERCPQHVEDARAAACPSVLAWNSAPARRRAMNTSGATSRTAMAVWRPSSPQSSRRPSTMATSPTPRPAMRSMESDRGRRGAGCAWWRRGRLRSPPPPRGATVRLAAEGAQGRQALDELEEPAGERPEAPPLPLGAPRRLATEEDHGHGHRDDQRHHDGEGQQVLGRHPRQQEERDDTRSRRLGEVARSSRRGASAAPGWR